MSRSLSVNILLPMDKYSSSNIYDKDDNLRQIYSGNPDMEIYFKRLKIRSVYSSSSDIEKYFQEKHGLGEGKFKNHSVSYNGKDFIYRFADGTSLNFTEEDDERIKREHIDEGIYCLPYKSYSVDVYGSVMNDLFEDEFTIIDDELINKTIELIGSQYSSDLLSEDSVLSNDSTEDNAIEQMIDYEGSMDGKLLVSLIIGQYIAKRVRGIAVAEYS